MVPESGSISQLDPFLDSRGISRVGGRLRKSNLTEEENHPVSNMIIDWSHHRAHGARGTTLNHLRKRDICIISASIVFPTSVSCKANYMENKNTKRWQIYHRKDALKQFHSHIVSVEMF